MCRSCFRPSACPAAGVFISSLQMLLGGCLFSRQDCGAAAVGALLSKVSRCGEPLRTSDGREGVSNLSFRPCTGGISSPPAPPSLPQVPGKGVTFPLHAAPGVQWGTPPTSNTRALWELFGGSGTNRPLHRLGVCLWSPPDPRKPGSRMVNLHLGMFAFHLASPTPPQGAHSVAHFMDAFQVKS